MDDMLVDALNRQDRAETALRSTERLIRDGADRAADIAADDAAVEAFAAWLPAAQRRAADARDAFDHAVLDVALARTVLHLGRRKRACPCPEQAAADGGAARAGD